MVGAGPVTCNPLITLHRGACTPATRACEPASQRPPWAEPLMRAAWSPLGPGSRWRGSGSPASAGSRARSSRRCLGRGAVGHRHASGWAGAGGQALLSWAADVDPAAHPQAAQLSYTITHPQAAHRCGRLSVIGRRGSRRTAWRRLGSMPLRRRPPAGILGRQSRRPSRPSLHPRHSRRSALVWCARGSLRGGLREGGMAGGRRATSAPAGMPAAEQRSLAHPAPPSPTCD